MGGFLRSKACVGYVSRTRARGALVVRGSVGGRGRNHGSFGNTIAEEKAMSEVSRRAFLNTGAGAAAAGAIIAVTGLHGTGSTESAEADQASEAADAAAVAAVDGPVIVHIK